MRSTALHAAAAALAALVFSNGPACFAQDGGQIHGNFNADGQLYNDDEAIGAQAPPQDFGMNSWMNLQFSLGKFQAGTRLESYEPALVGYPAGQPYQGTGIGYRYATWTIDDLEVTAGNFYEQFGQGLVFRSYEERNLGVDNAMDGVRVKFRPDTGIYLKGFIGRQRFGFVNGFTKGPGLVRGIDGEVSLTELFPSCFSRWLEKGNNLMIGGSFVSKYQEDKDPLLELPENVGAWAARLNYTTPRWNFYAEYAYKINDPNSSNTLLFADSVIRPIYKNGQAALFNATYSVKGLGISAGVHGYDNMIYRSDRGSPTPFDLNINFLPSLSKQHTYNLASTLYPYATQPNGEVAAQAELFYKFKKGTKLGGAHGTKLAVNWSGAWALDSTALRSDTATLVGYSSNFPAFEDRMYFSDFNIEVRKKMGETWELALSWINLAYDVAVVQGKAGKPVIYADIVVLEGLHNFNDRNSVRFELQHLSTKQDSGSWATGLVEFTFSPHWFIAALDQVNYGGAVETTGLHYPYASTGYIRGGNRFSLSYGRQRAGIFCVGGVCRTVPASNGVTLSITSTF